MRSEKPGRALRVPAYAKINLGLEVLGLRQDGYHELRTIFQTVELHDTITVRPAASGISLSCDHPTLATDETNLAYRAARDLLRYGRVKGGVQIDLAKRIPIAGGLGGGSSDAAAVLRAVDALYGLGLGRVGLHPLARRLGADVPYFLFGGTALGLARGDEVFPLQSQIAATIVLVDPARPVSTAAVFRRIDARLTPRENSYRIFRFVSSDLEGSPSFRVLSNDLEQAALEEAPDLARRLRRIRGVLLREGAKLASLSGSGSAYYGVYDDPLAARRAQQALIVMGFTAWCCRTLTLDRYRRAWSRSLSRQGARRGRAK
jgi:4-diphosphocytidyl-2-C-methyl-D-erythritol kinase